VFVFVSVFVYVCKEVNNKRTPGVLVICIASSCTKKNAQEKEPKKKYTKLQKNMHRLRGKKEKRKTNIAKPRGVDHMQSNASLPPLFLFFPC
jgi:hypothetical protein